MLRQGGPGQEFLLISFPELGMELTLGPVLRGNAGTAPGADGGDGTLGGALYRHQDVVDGQCDVLSRVGCAFVPSPLPKCGLRHPGHPPSGPRGCFRIGEVLPLSTLGLLALSCANATRSSQAQGHSRSRDGPQQSKGQSGPCISPQRDPGPWWQLGAAAPSLHGTEGGGGDDVTQRGGHQPSPAPQGMVLPAGHVPAGHSWENVAKAPRAPRQEHGTQTPSLAGLDRDPIAPCSARTLMEIPQLPFPEQVSKSPSPRKGSTRRDTGSRSRDGCPVAPWPRAHCCLSPAHELRGSMDRGKLRSP